MSKLDLFIFLISFLAYIAMTSGTFWESDSQAAYQTVKSVVESGDFAMPCFWATQAPNGNCYSQYGVFISVVIIPFYFIEKLFRDLGILFFPPGFFSSLTNAFITSLLVLLVYKYLKRLNFSEKIAILSSFIFAFATYLPGYTRTLYSEPLITLLLLGSLYLLLFYKHTKAILFSSSLFFGLAFLTKIAVVAFVPLYLYTLIYKKTPLKNIFLYSLPFILCVGIFLLYNYVRFGHILDTGYRNIKFDNPFFYGLYLHLLSPGKSFFLYQPIILFSFLGFKRFLKQQKHVFLLFTAFAVIHIVFYSFYMHPMGDITLGSRYIYPILPFFIFSIAYFIQNNKSQILKYLFITFLIVSLLIQASTIYLSYHRYFAYLYKKYSIMGTNYISIAYNLPEYSPLLWQWKLIFRSGYNPEDEIYWREAFQEYPPFKLDYKIAPPDLFFARSKITLPIFIAFMLIDLLLLYKIFRILEKPKKPTTKRLGGVYGENNESWLDAFIQFLRFREIKQLIPKNSFLVDLGCGFNGTLLSVVSDKLKKGIGFDLSVRKDNSLGRIQFKKADLNKKIPIKTNFCDVVTAIAVVEHVIRPDILLKEAFRILEPGGVLILTTPSKKAKPLLEFLAFKLGIISKEEISDHKRYYDENTLEIELVKAGFKRKNIYIKNFQLGFNIFAKCIK